jgi:phosphatidate cytidylyltransferase
MTDVEILQRTAELLFAVAAVFLVVHLAAARLRRKPVQWARVASQVGLYVGFLLISGAPEFFLALAVALCSFLAFGELRNAAAAKNRRRYTDPRMTLVYGGGMSLVPFVWNYFPIAIAPFCYTLTGLLFALPVLTGKPRNALDRISYPLAGGLAAMSWSFLVPLRNGPQGMSLTLFLLFVLNISEMAAYILGRAFGRHRLAKVSPGKTVEGSVLGTAAAVALAAALRGLLLPGLTLGKTMVLAVAISVSGVVGDLITSAIKRDAGLKDYGTTIPGHGGMLDRFDGLLLAAPLFYFLTRP